VVDGKVMDGFLAIWFAQISECMSDFGKVHNERVKTLKFPQQFLEEQKLKLASFTYIHAYIHTYMHTYMHACIHACIHTCMYTYKHAYIHACIHTHIHTYIHTYTHAYIYTYIKTDRHRQTGK